MIDIHSHILPELDDGSRSLDESVAMAKMAMADGVRTMVATPHYDHPHFRTDLLAADEARASLNARLQKEGVDLKVVRGGEITLSPNTRERLSERQVPLLGSGPYFLLELCDPIPQGFEQHLFEHRLAGRHAVLAHVERERAFQDSPERLHRLVEQGVLCQITAMSITGEFGSRAEKAARELLKRRLVHFIASDSHGAKRRPPGLARAVEVAATVLGNAADAEALVTDNPRRLLAGDVLDLEPPPQAPAKRRWFSWG